MAVQTGDIISRRAMAAPTSAPVIREDVRQSNLLAHALDTMMDLFAKT
jgi:hypothetical protein